MDEEISFKMSLLLDGELSAKETVALWKSIEQDSALAAQWKRYNQIRSVMNSQIPVSARPDLVESVHQALLSEPTVIAPNTLSRPKAGKSKYVLLRRTGMIAASGVLALMVYGYQQVHQVTPVQSPPSSVDIMADNVVAESTPVEAVETRTQPVQAATSQVYSSARIPSERAFNEYLVSHGEYSYSISPQPLIPAARVVSLNTGN